MAGVSPTYISAGKYKTEGNDLQPLSEEARAALQSRIDEYYSMFLKAVARGRATTTAAVRDGFGQGRVVGASEAVSLGMADRIGTIEDAVARAARPIRTSNKAAELIGMDLIAAADLEDVEAATKAAPAIETNATMPGIALRRKYVQLWESGSPAKE